MSGFLPISIEDMKEQGIAQLDFVYVVGDAYVDHPSFGHAIISRVLQAHGYQVGIVSQPDWKAPKSIAALGRPRLGFLVTAGNMDSMVNHYSVSKKRRATDAYTPGGVMGRRPDYATAVYCRMIRQIYPDIPIIIGGIEASLRRLSHYDYWSGKVKPSLLLESGADLISYGMGERSIVEIADALAGGLAVSDLTYIRGTVYKTADKELAALAWDGVAPGIQLPGYEKVRTDKTAYARSFYIQYQNTDPFQAGRIYEPYEKYNGNLNKIVQENFHKNSDGDSNGNTIYVVQNPPALPLSQMELDDIYALPYMRTYHPSYEAAGGVPAISEVKFSLVSNRGCFGGCNFCALTFHQGRIVQARSHDSIVEEAKKLIQEPDFKGYIHDVGGPTANFRRPACKKQMAEGACANRQCLFPKPCKNLEVDHSDYLRLLRRLRELDGVKKVFIRSGIRYDYLMYDNDRQFLHELCEHHVSGQLKVAPEHISDAVLDKLGKPSAQVYRDFVQAYEQMNRTLGKKQYLVPYLMSSHPGSTLKDAVKLAEFLRDSKCTPQQVQDFYPTPSTISTCMYYTGMDPRTMQPVYVAGNPHEKAMQRALIQYRNPKNYGLVKEALEKTGRQDLIGYGKTCLIPPRPPRQSAGQGQKAYHSPQAQNEERRRKKTAKTKTIRNVHKKIAKSGGRA